MRERERERERCTKGSWFILCLNYLFLSLFLSLSMLVQRRVSKMLPDTVLLMMKRERESVCLCICEREKERQREKEAMLG